jgi:hypothetical protein
MIQTKRLKIWMIVTHVLIIIGAGHGIACFGLLEVFWIYGLIKSIVEFHIATSLFTGLTSITVLFSIAAQIAILRSLVRKNIRYKTVAFILSIILFWLSIVAFIIAANEDSYTVILQVSVLPFLICTIIAFLGKPIKRFYYWVIDVDFAEEE